MTEKIKGRTGGYPADPKTACKRNATPGLTSRVKATLVILALWGWFPLGWAERIDRLGGRRDD